MSESRLLSPGTNIKPVITIDDCRSMFLKLYGLQCFHFQELNGYDDKNYKVIVNINNNRNEHINDISASGYILKIMNSLDSKKQHFVEGQNSLLLFLGQSDVKCPKPVKNTNGNYYSLESLSSGDHIVRLMEFMPGRVLLGVPYNQSLFYEVGKNVATIDLILQKFHHPAYETHKTLWMLDSVPELLKFLFVIKDNEYKMIISDIISRFKDEILTNIHQFERGIIHGDCNEQNILVEKHTNGSYRFKAILDFGDTSYGCYLFELAITMLYMMLLENDIKAGCQVLMGYDSVRKVVDLELNNLLLCITSRLCQSLVLGAYTSQLDPENSSYVLTTSKNGWDLLTYLYKDDGSLIQMWKQVIGR